MKLSRNFRSLSVLLSTAAFPVQVGFCMDDNPFGDLNQSDHKRVLSSPPHEDMLEVAQLVRDQFLERFLKNGYLPSFYEKLSLMIEKNPSLAITIIKKTISWIELGKWDTYDITEVILAFKDMEEKKISFLYDKVTPWIKKWNWSGYHAAEVILAFKDMEEKKISFLYDILPSWVSKWNWTGCNTRDIILAFKDMEQEKISLLYENLTPRIEKWGGDYSKTAKIITYFQNVSNQFIPPIILLAQSFSEIVWGELTAKKFLLGVKLFHLYENQEDAYRFMTLIENKTQKCLLDQKKDLFDILLYHAIEDREAVLNLWTPALEDTLSLSDMGVLIFIPRALWRDYQQKRLAKLIEGNRTGTVLLGYHQTLVQEGAQTCLHYHWADIIHSPRINALEWCANFITRNSLVLGLDEEEDEGLYQWAIRSLINAGNRDDPKNIFKIHNDLLQKRKEFNPKALEMPAELIDEYSVSLNPLFFKDMSAYLKFDPKEVPEINEKDFERMWESLKEKKKEVKKLTGILPEDLLNKDKLFYLSQLLATPQTSLLGAQWKSLVKYILNLPSLPKNEGLCEQQEVLALHLLSIQNCNTGKEDGIKRSYYLLPHEYKLKGVAFTSSPALWIMETLSQGINSVINNGVFLRALLNYGSKTEIAQESHQIKYVMGLVANHIGLPWQIQFDPNGNILLEDLLKLKAQETVQLLYDEVFTPSIAVSYLQKRINQRLEEEKDRTAFANFLNSLVTVQSIKGMWKIKEKEKEEGWTYHYKSITPYGVMLLLEELGAMKIDRDQVLPWGGK